MVKEPIPLEQTIAEILDPDKPLTNARLTCLSDLNNEELELLRQAWSDVDVMRRRQVMSQLIHLSEVDFKLDFSSIFISCLADSDETIRTQAIDGLEIEEDYRFINPLLKSMREDSSVRVRAAAAIALGKFTLSGELGELSTDYTNKIYSALLDILDNKTESTEVKSRALEAIAPLSLPRIIELITEAYHTGNFKLKASAIHAMGRNCNPRWLNILLTELNSNEAEIRYVAANACGELGADEAVPHLIKLIKDEDDQVQEAAIGALGVIGGEQAEQILRKLAQDTHERIRQAAKSALEEIHFCEDLPSLNLYSDHQ